MSMKTYDMTVTKDCVAYIVNLRYACRREDELLTAAHGENLLAERRARICRKLNSPFAIRTAENLEAIVKKRRDLMKVSFNLLLEWGRELMEFSSLINANVPQSLLLDLLNVNVADRGEVSPDDGIIEIVNIHGLEDSAMYRGGDWKQGPLAQAITQFISHEMIHNEQLAQAAHEHLFGKGGMFDFLPRYTRTPEGEMVKQPPKLRLADECDLKD